MNNQNDSLSNLTTWYERRKLNIVFSKSSGWVELGKGVLQAYPYHWIIHPTIDEISDLLRKNKKIALRYSTSLESLSGHISYHVVYDKPSYELSTVPKKARHDVVRGLSYAAYENISLNRLSSEGWKLRYETLVRQGRKNAETQKFWQRLCLSADGLDGFEAWGAIHDGELIAALLAYTADGTTSILYQQSKTDHLEFGVNNALTFTFTETVVHRPTTKQIFYGLHSLDAPQSVDKFKLRMGYIAMPVRQEVVFNPLIRPLINKLSYQFLRKLLVILPGNEYLSKVEGIVRFNVHGMRLLAEQEWPDVIGKQKDYILANLS
jgi:hypothetical protein